MPTTPVPFHTGKIKADDLSELIASREFVPDTGPVDALSYELGGIERGGSLNHYFRLLVPIRATEVVQYKVTRRDQRAATPGLLPAYRVMAVLWYGKYYHRGLALEVFGEDIRDHMTKVAHDLNSYFGNEVPIVVRTLTRRMLEWDGPK